MKKFNKKEIEFIQNRASERITEIFDALGIDYEIRYDYIQCMCPIHDGDNPRSLYWAMQSSHWKCTTRQCEQEPMTGPSSSIFGLVRGVMTTKTKKRWTFYKSVLYIIKILNIADFAINDNDIDSDIEITKALKKYRQEKKMQVKQDYPLLADTISKLSPDTTYYPNRGISKDTIAKYHISYCDSSNRQFFQRAFFPILDPSGRYIVGWSARSIWKKCQNCMTYHSPQLRQCPPTDKRRYYPKWKHSKGFKCENYLYNYWLAKPFIYKTGTAIICESPGNCWAFDSCDIKNSVAIFGLNLSKTQRMLLQQSGALTLIFALDNDEAGQRAVEKFKQQLNYYFRLFFVTPKNCNDIADMLDKDIKDKFLPALKLASMEQILSKA